MNKTFGFLELPEKRETIGTALSFFIVLLGSRGDAGHYLKSCALGVGSRDLFDL